jgi:glycolate oxidase iron-sulfur subunit
MFSRTNEATARVLAKNGCEVVVPRGQACCGALHVHLGRREQGKALARQNVLAFSAEDVDAIVINAAGCGAMMKEYGDLLADDPELSEKAKAAAGKSRDISEFLASIELNTEFGEVRARAAYHDACHLAHAQKITAAPRNLLAQVPGLELIPLAESDVCCGSAGPYSLVEPEMAARLLKRKVRHIRETGADMVISGNPGCNLQIASGLREEGLDKIEVLHTVDVLDRAYRVRKG